MDKQVMKMYTRKKIIDEASDIMVIPFITCISTSDDANQPQMGTIKAKSMALGPHHYERVAKAAKHQEFDSADNELNTIGRCEIDIRENTCCDGKNWRLLSTTGQLCDVKLFHNSCKTITNVPVGGSAIVVVHDHSTIIILILNEALFFGN